MNRKLIGAMFVVVAVVACVPQVWAGAITVNDYSFDNENAAGAANYFVLLPDGGSPTAGGGWVSGPAGGSYSSLAILAGAYSNWSNVDGDNFCGMYSPFANLGAQWTGQLLTTTYQAGYTYDLTMAMGTYDAVAADRTAYVELAYKDGSGVLQSIGGTAKNSFLQNTLPDGALSNNPLNALEDKSSTITVGASDAWAGKQILVRFGCSLDSSGGRLVVDNVRLTATPEPSSIMLVASTLVGLLAYAWRKRK
jgi:hypothetical protein